MTITIAAGSLSLALVSLLTRLLLLVLPPLLLQLNSANSNLSRMLLEHLKWMPHPAGEGREGLPKR